MFKDSVAKCFLRQYQINSLKTIHLEASIDFLLRSTLRETESHWVNCRTVWLKVQITAERKRNQYWRLFVYSPRCLSWAYMAERTTMDHVHTSVNWHSRLYWLTEGDKIRLYCDSDMFCFVSSRTVRVIFRPQIIFLHLRYSEVYSMLKAYWKHE